MKKLLFRLVLILFIATGADAQYLGFNYEGFHRKLWGLSINLRGPHQIINATTPLGAMEVLDDLGYRVSNDAMTEGLKEVDWPGRLEMISSSPKVLLDGAHNPDGALSLKESLGKDFE